MFVGIYFVFGALSSLQLSSGASPKKNDDNSPIVFPGPTQGADNRYGTANMTDKCMGIDFCSIKPDDYPQEHYNKMFRGIIKEPIFLPTYVMTDDRQGDPDEVDDCETTIKYEPLYRVKDKQGQSRTVIQAPEENYVQMVRLETCNAAETPCFTQFRVPIDLQTLCKQKYNVWEFLVDDGKGGSERVKVDLPVCCSCHYKAKGI